MRGAKWQARHKIATLSQVRFSPVAGANHQCCLWPPSGGHPTFPPSARRVFCVSPAAWHRGRPIPGWGQIPPTLRCATIRLAARAFQTHAAIPLRWSIPHGCRYERRRDARGSQGARQAAQASASGSCIEGTRRAYRTQKTSCNFRVSLGGAERCQLTRERFCLGN